MVAASRRASDAANRAAQGGKFAGRVVPEEDLRTEPLPRPSGNLEIVRPRESEGSRQGQHLQPGRLVQHRRRGRAQLRAALPAHRRREGDRHSAADLDVAHLRSLRRQAAADRVGLPQPAEAVEQPLQGARDGHPDRGCLAQAGPRVRADARSRRDGHRPLSRSGFVHIDVRSPPSYRWVDKSPPNSNASEKRPPRGWKRKKLES